MSEKTIYDGFGAFDLGINSGMAPQLLPKNQLAFATDATMRGDFVQNRPARKLMTLQGTNIPLSLFHGACGYQADSGVESIMLAAGGKLYQITPSEDTADVSDQTGATGGQSTTAYQHWLWQGENFVIWDDGQNLPIFWDGTSSRRSLGEQYTDIGTIQDNVNAPALGASIVVTLTGIPNLPFPQVAQLLMLDGTGKALANNGAYYEVRLGGGSNQANVTDIYDTHGVVHPTGSQILSIPQNIGYVMANAGSYAVVTGTTPFTITYSIRINLTLSSTSGIAIGTKVIATSATTNQKVLSLSGNDVTLEIKQVTLNVGGGGLPPSYSILAGTLVKLFNNTLPSTIVGVLAADLIAPYAGDIVQITLEQPYVGTPGAIVWIEGAQYSIVPILASSNQVTITNKTDGTGLTIKNGILRTLPELPAGRMGAYGEGRIWISAINGIEFLASDIVGGASGSQPYNGRDAILKVTENTFLLSGNFKVTGDAGTIAAMVFPAMLDTSMGQGPLQVFCTNLVFSCQTPVDATTWQDLTNPILPVALRGAGGSGQDGVILVNADTIFRANDNQIRSMLLARLDFNKWGNTPISHEVERVINDEDTTLMAYCRGIEFDNRALITCDPLSTAYGVVWQGLLSLNLDPLSSIAGKSQSIWEGRWTGLNVLQLIRFKNSNRAFALALGATNLIELWELLPSGVLELDSGTTSITWSFETPMMFLNTKGKGMFDLVNLTNGELYISDLLPNSTIHIKVEYRPDYYESGWFLWHEFYVTTDANTQQYRTRVGLGSPKIADKIPFTNTPARVGRWFQLKITVTGHCRLMGGLFSAEIAPQIEFPKPLCT